MIIMARLAFLSQSPFVHLSDNFILYSFKEKRQDIKPTLIFIYNLGDNAEGGSWVKDPQPLCGVAEVPERGQSRDQQGQGGKIKFLLVGLLVNEY